MSIKRVENYWRNDWTCFYLTQEWETHEGGRILVKLTVDGNTEPVHAYWESYAHQLAQSKYEGLLMNEGDLSKNYIIKG